MDFITPMFLGTKSRPDVKRILCEKRIPEHFRTLSSSRRIHPETILHRERVSFHLKTHLNKKKRDNKMLPQTLPEPEPERRWESLGIFALEGLGMNIRVN